MAGKNAIKVLIDGKAITLAGYEDEEYLQRVANYINKKISGFREMPGYRRMASEMKGTLLALNIADDYFKAKMQADAIEESMENREQDSYELKQEYVSAQIEIEKLSSENASLKKQLEDLTRRLEARSGYRK